MSGHAEAVLDHLRATGILVGDGSPPAGRGWQGPPGHSDFVGYAILWHGGGISTRSATVDDLFEIGTPRFYVRSFGESADACRDVSFELKHRMLHVPLVVPGRVVHRVVPEEDAVNAERVETEVGLWEWQSAYRVHTSPA